MRKILCALAVLAGACGGGGGNSVTGSVAGKSLVAADAIALTGAFNGQGGVQVVISEQAGACVEYGNDRFKQKAALLTIALAKKGGEVPTGKYNVGVNGDVTAGAVWFVTDDKCKAGTPTPATAGTITLDRNTDGAGGSFDLTIGGSNVKGTFDGKFCLWVAKPFSPDSDATCKP